MAMDTFVAAGQALSQRPSCGILRSPDKLDTSHTSPGQDRIKTQEDFKCVWRWLKSANFLTTGFYNEDLHGKLQLQQGTYNSLIQKAFGLAFDPIRNTFNPTQDEMVLLYYTGHGLDRQNAATYPNCSSSPHFDKLGFGEDKLQEYSAAERDYLTSNRNVKGGELCLHDFGFCDLEGLLTPWIAALKSRSMNAPGEKKKKHLIVIADSCYSGMLVQDLQQLALRRGPWNESGCTVTVQSACSSNEPTTGGYFTPCFVYFNKPENREKLQELKGKWDVKREREKNAYSQVDLPTPQVATTMSSDKLRSKKDDPIMLLPVIQGFQLTLFRDAGFFKFCFLSLSGIVGSEVRALTSLEDNNFLKENKFVIMDYKLKKISNGTPMALFLVEDPNDNDHVVCVHIHVLKGKVSRVNLIHHKRPTNVGQDGHLFLEEIFDCKRECRLENTVQLVKQCKAYVEQKEPGRWTNITRWNMTKSFHSKFRLKERSAWMDNYVKKMAPENSQTSYIFLPCTILICIVAAGIYKFFM